MRQSRKIATKFTDPNPLNKVVFDTSGIGPDTKNLARLNDPANELMRKEIIGTVLAFMPSVDVRSPSAFVGKKDEVNIMRANEMWHCKIKHM